MSEYTKEDKVTILTDNAFKNGKMVLKRFQNRCGLVSFYAPWCTYCQQLAPIIKFLGKQLKSHSFQIGVLNGDAYPNVIHTFKVRSYPTLFWVNHTGQLEPYEEPNRDIETILQGICNMTQKYNSEKWKILKSKSGKSKGQQPQQKQKQKRKSLLKKKTGKKRRSVMKG